MMEGIILVHGTVISVHVLTYISDCGGYWEIGPSTGTGSLYSPSYPAMYGTYSKCIWLIRADDNYRVQISVTYTGERYNGDCADYLEVSRLICWTPLKQKYTYAS